MKYQIKRVLSEIFNNRINFPNSIDPAKLPEATQHLLSAYVEAELDGKNAADLFPEVEAGIAKFPHFAEEHAILFELLDADRRGELETPPFTPTFDFSYLNLPQPKDVLQADVRPVDSLSGTSIREDQIEEKAEVNIWQVNTIGNLLIHFTEDLVTSLRSQTPQLAPLHNLKTGLTSREEWKTWLEYKLPRPTTDIDVIVTVKHIGNESDFCNVVVKVDIPSRDGWPKLAGSHVQLNGPKIETINQETDPFGEVIFESIEKKSVPYLKFEVTPVTS